MSNNSLLAVDVTFSYASDMTIENISFEAREGIIGIIGPNGSGKSTLLKLLAGTLMPHKGSITIGGRDIQAISAKEKARQVFYLPSENYLPQGFTALDIALMGRSSRLGFFADYSEDDIQAGKKALAETGMQSFENRDANSLSSGERQKVMLAQAIAQGSRFLLLDEPTSHMDIGQQAKTFRLIRSLSQTRGITAIAAVHDLNAAALFCDKLTLLCSGRQLASGTSAEVITPSNIEQAYGPGIEVSTRSGNIPEVKVKPVHG